MTLHHAHSFPEYSIPRLFKTNSHKKFQRILGVHVNGHDTSVSIVENGKLIEIIELERVFREKHYRVNVLHPRYSKMLDWLFNEYKLDANFDAVAIHIHHYGSEPREHYSEVQKITVQYLKKFIPDAHYLQLSHHLCHASSSYFCSPFDKACILSFDGHGDDGSTIGFYAEGNRISYVKGWSYSMGRAYSALSNIIGGIQSEDGNSAGKVMGLTGYGKVIKNWIEPVKQFIYSYQGVRSEFSPQFWEASVADGVFDLPGYGVVAGKNTFGGPDLEISQNFATTFQHCWTDIVKEMIFELIRETGCKNVCLVGGCALNAAANYEILNMPEVEDLHLIPHPNDEGLSAGAALYAYYAYQNIDWKGSKERYFSPYIGLPVLDINDLPLHVEQRRARKLNDCFSELSALLANGMKIGVIQGNSEIGPRALGNRSIICDPRDPDMKDKLNRDVKGREWYRPFAPFVKLENQSRYFNIDVPVPYMSVIGYVLPEFKNIIPSVIHADGTARVQTVSQELNPFLWGLLNSFEELTGVGVLLNTSLNGKGEPIISRLSEALKILDTTELDAIYCDDYLFT
jgi:carbamoyltransferase